jgi:putative transposase
VPGLCLLSVSRLSVQRRTSYPVMPDQVDKPSEALVHEPPTQKASGRRGRPQGRKHRNRHAVELSPARGCIQKHIKRGLEQIGDAFKVVSCLFDGACGQNDARPMVRQGGRPRISKLRSHSARSFPYDGPDCGRGPRRHYGQTVDGRPLPSAYVPSTAMEKEIKTQLDQMSLWPKKFAAMLHVVVIVQTNRHPHQTAHVVLFRRDLTLGYALWIDSYRLRCPLECNFRDAKQYWGREDCMNVNARPVSNGAKLALCMVNVSHALIRPMRAQGSAFSVHDLKAWFRGQKYVVETLKLLPEPPDPIFIDQVVSKMAELGQVNHAVNSV